MEETVKKIFTFIIAMLLIVSLAACSINDKAIDPAEPSAEQSAEEVVEDSAKEEIPKLPEELCGMYVSSKNQEVSFELTREEITFDDKDQFASSPVYKCVGDDKQAIGIYSFEVNGNILNVTDWYGEIIIFEIVKDGDSVTLKFKEDEFNGSWLEGGCPEFLTDLVKQ